MRLTALLLVVLCPLMEAGAGDFESIVPDGPQGLGWRVPAVTDPALQERCDRIYLLTQRLARYLLASVKPWDKDASLLLATESGSKEPFIRPNAGIACGLAFLYRFGPYDFAEVGISRAELLRDRILPMIRYLTATHVTGSRETDDRRRWGNAWQSALWARILGQAAWQLGPDLPEELAVQVRRVVAHEADRIAGAEPPHQIARDTKAEENAWNSSVLSTAIVLLPRDPRRHKWEQTFQRWALSSFLRPADATAEQEIDGRPLGEQFTGANIHDDFTLENHNIVHPDYMTSASLLLGCGLEHVLTGRSPPEAIMHNVPGVYENLKWFALPDGGFMYPSGQDWALFRNADWLYPHVLMAVLAGDNEAWTLADRSLDALERMQARSTSGTIYLPEENFFASASSDKLCQYGMAWLALHFAQRMHTADPQRVGVRHLRAGKIILNRTTSAVHTVSWGSHLMARCAPWQLDRIASPHPRSGVGSIRLAGEKKPLAVKLVETRVEADSRGFTVHAVVEHGETQVRADLTYISQPDGTLVMRERLTAGREVRIEELATGLIGILNNGSWVYERGERVIHIGNEHWRVPACSGRVLRAQDVHAIDVDDTLRITSERPLAVCYRGADAPHRGRATDELCLQYATPDRLWPAGTVISEYKVRLRCTPAASAPAR